MRVNLTLRDVNGAPLHKPIEVELPTEDMMGPALRIQFDCGEGVGYGSQITEFDVQPTPPANYVTLQVVRT